MTLTETGMDYDATLRILSEASTEQHFEAFRDIDWDAPEMQFPPGDDRWALPASDPIARHPWYTSLPRERQIAVARHRLTALTKTGSQFEQLLLLGGTQFLMGLKNDNPEFRYFMHELTEECHHIQMFQEFTNRACPEVSGVPRWLLHLFPFVGHLGGLTPALFFAIILAGEEPIDHVQKNQLRGGGIHPLLDRVMSIHIAEEARHIGFAHAWLDQHSLRLNRFQRWIVGAITGIFMRIGADAILKPSRRDRKMMGMPRYVVRDCFERGPEAAKFRRDLFADVRACFERNRMLTRSNRWVWKLAGTDGRPSRYRAEPA
ncbi:MAG TPA: diiron oxygenase, partial [Nocardioides sp.]|nr:diiron oxygenase [Nocardioides sp.]